MEFWIKNHFNRLHELQLDAKVTHKMLGNISLADGFKYYFKKINALLVAKGKLIFIGNGGSAAISSHLANDYSKNGHIPAVAFNDPSVLTCLSNDFGYENVYAKQIEFHAHKNDIIVAISSSGQSQNLIKAVAAARATQCLVITFTGFDNDNRLRQLGDLNFYIASNDYGFVEVAHLGLAHAMLDYIIQEKSSANNQQEILSTMA